MISRRNISLFLCICGILFFGIAYTNCSPVHDGEATSGSQITDITEGGAAHLTCLPFLQDYYDTTIQNSTTCAGCHASTNNNKPFRVSFKDFIKSLSSGTSESFASLVEEATETLTNVLEGGTVASFDHTGMASSAGGEALAVTIKSEVKLAVEDYEDCLLENAE